MSRRKPLPRYARPSLAASSPRAERKTLAALAPLGALACGFGFASLAMAQNAEPAAEPKQTSLPQLTVKGTAERTGKESYQATTTTAGKGKQELRDVPQSVTVVTEKLMDDKNYDTLKAAMHTVTGIAFEAGEGGAIGDLIRIRGFSARGDIFQDGMRDIAQYNRDTFNQDRIEVLRGSASMLYGRGSTGGIINQVSKQPILMDQHSVEFTAGTDDYYRLTGDFNLKTGEDAALRINVMKTDAKSFRNGPETDRQGIAPTYRWGIGTANEFSVGFYHLSYDDVPDYGFRWLNGRPVEAAVDRWYGFESDYQKDSANYGFLSWLHRFDNGGEIKTTYRDGRYKRDLWSTTAGFGAPLASEDEITDATPITLGGPTRGAKDRHRFLQTDYTGKADWFGYKHNLLAGAEYTREETTTFTYSGTPPKGAATWGDTGPFAGVPDTRVKARATEFSSNTVGVYVQDVMELTPVWKLLAGLRFDRFSGDYERLVGGPLSRTDEMWSHRIGAMYQPSLSSSYYISAGTSFNASGDLYQFDGRTPEDQAKSANTPPEKSRNFEIGAKWDLYDGNLSLRTALFRTVKYNERNTDVEQALDAYVLSGKRHTDGIEFEAAGRPLPALEIFGGVAYMRGKIDKPGSSTNAALTVGKDSGLTPRWTGNIWATYRLTPKWRVGIGADGMSDRVPASGEAPNLQTGITNRAPGYVKADAMVEYDAGPYSVKLNLINLADKVYADGLYRGFTVPGQTRAAQLTLAAKF
ncbi:TonB-dependent siderophore receptor [Aquabacterium sp. A7-Y]|uniref:TonB-dependent receptor n=1 Tax=Aquabacterium sp. A7-Y TaxID=1349605 RepID=UPI00223D53EB|nr:TonB-dependent siderophore receptor [Aquabacterium sp. A7-Y]MCW7538990.1 TonB-dependent siderophore receptor [Aquabacterium sp. A7-Y]